MDYPKRLIEVDLPIKKISAHARREKDMRRCHVPLLYIWPATRPPAACRAVLCASLWLDPVDLHCPQVFRDQAASIITDFAKKVVSSKELSKNCSSSSWTRWNTITKSDQGLDPESETEMFDLRRALLDFIADFANWDNSTEKTYLEVSRKLTQLAHEAITGIKESEPFISDPFAGGGAIPLEGLRIGANVFSSDLNAVAAFYNKIILEFIPKFGTEIITEINKWSEWIRIRINEELREYYPEGDDNSIPVAYLWTRTITCEGPGCGSTIPLIRHTNLTRKGNVALQMIPQPSEKKVDFKIVHNSAKVKQSEGTIKRGSVTCPCCGYTNPIESVRKQLQARNGGTNDAQMYCVVSKQKNSRGRLYRQPNNKDINAFNKARLKLDKYQKKFSAYSLVPDEPLPQPLKGRSGTLGMGLQGYGIKKWGDLFNYRQSLAHVTYIKLSKEYLDSKLNKKSNLSQILAGVITLVINRMVDLNSSLCAWQLNTPNTDHVFKRWALSMINDYGLR